MTDEMSDQEKEALTRKIMHLRGANNLLGRGNEAEVKQVLDLLTSLGCNVDFEVPEPPPAAEPAAAENAQVEGQEAPDDTEEYEYDDSEEDEDEAEATEETSKPKSGGGKRKK